MNVELAGERFDRSAVLVPGAEVVDLGIGQASLNGV
jgi:hypothetical protein